MKRTFVVGTFLVFSFVSAVGAQDHRVEISGWGGYTFSEGINIDPNTSIGILVREINPTNGASYGASVNVFVTDEVQVGFLWDRHESNLELRGTGGAGKANATDLNVHNYHGIFTYNFGDSRDPMRPYIMGGIGATQYSPGDFMGAPVEGATKFSSTWGGGVKFYAGDVFGINVGGRWTPTYIKSDPGGIWCNPFWPGGCWLLSDPDYANQLELFGGIVLRF